MKYYIPYFFVFILTFFIKNSFAEINNKKALMDVFEGCVEEEVPDVSVGAQFNYCGCFIKEISLGMDLEEVMTLGLDIMSVEEDKKLQQKILISNRKIKKYIVKCASKLYEWSVTATFGVNFVTIE